MDITVNGLVERNDGAKQGTNGHAINDPSYKQINEKLEQITRYLLQEMDAKQRTIEEQRQEIAQFKAELTTRSNEIAELEEKLTQCAEHREGHRQLINKLLNDIEHFQNDIEWYKRTYERRSFWGVLKEKLIRRK
jgi:DNA repair exonuclease SbcCD ATPase subunit